MKLTPKKEINHKLEFIMSLIDKLPLEIYEYVLWLSCGPINLDICNKKKCIADEINHYNLTKNVQSLGFYLTFIENYEKTPELEFIPNYVYAQRIPKLVRD